MKNLDKIIADSQDFKRRMLELQKNSPAYTGREIDLELIEIDDMEINTSDYPDFCDSFILSANWIDTGKELTDDELDELNTDAELIYNLCIDRIF